MLKYIKYDDGIIAEVLANNSIQVTSPEGTTYVISGFPNASEIEQFLLFGDLETRGDNNDFIIITKPSYTLEWTCKLPHQH